MRPRPAPTRPPCLGAMILRVTLVSPALVWVPLVWVPLACVTLLCVTLAAAPALAGDASPDKSPYGLLQPTPDTALRTFSPDRPLNSVSPYTVDAGRIQIESDFGLLTRTDDGRTTTRSIEALDPLIRVGLTPSLELGVEPTGLFVDRTTSDRTGRTRAHDIGTGDVIVRAKYNVFGNDSGTYALAVLPLLLVPSGDRHFGDPYVDGGVLVPLNVSLPSGFDLVLETGAQTARTDSGTPYASITNIANLTHAIPGIDKLSGSVELTSIVNAERHTPDVYTFDVALAYLTTPETQLDVGAFIGLNRGAPDLQVSAGIARRF